MCLENGRGNAWTRAIARIAAIFVGSCVAVGGAWLLGAESANATEPAVHATAAPEDQLVVFEAPYKLGARYVLRSEADAKLEAEAIARWNEGGRARSWHPQPRVIVDNVRVKGAISGAAVLKTARAQGYWPIRRCYDPALPDKPDLRGGVSVKITIDGSGRATQTVVVGQPSLSDRQVVECIRNGLRGFKYPASRRATSDVTLDVTVGPGDALMKRVENPAVTAGAGDMDYPVVQALVARHAGADVIRCYSDAARREPGLWGRLVLRLDVAPNGAVRDIVEIDSTFPDSATTKCAIDAIRKIGFPPPTNGNIRIVVPIRFGSPPGL